LPRRERFQTERCWGGRVEYFLERGRRQVGFWQGPMVLLSGRELRQTMGQERAGVVREAPLVEPQLVG